MQEIIDKAKAQIVEQFQEDQVTEIKGRLSTIDNCTAQIAKDKDVQTKEEARLTAKIAIKQTAIEAIASASTLADINTASKAESDALIALDESN